MSVYAHRLVRSMRVCALALWRRLQSITLLIRNLRLPTNVCLKLRLRGYVLDIWELRLGIPLTI